MGVFMGNILREIIEENKYLSEYSDFYFCFLLQIENIIPEEFRNIFYDNLKTLEIELNYGTKKESKGKTTYGIYDAKINKITMFPHTLYKKCKKSKCTLDEFEALFMQSLCHEFLHMSSTFKKNNRIFSGPDIYPPIVKPNKNRGLTEGLTEYIVYMNSPINPIVNSGYFIELRFVQLLNMIVDTKDLLCLYFGNYPTSYLSSKFLEFGISQESGNRLFELIENSYVYRNEEEEQPFTAFSQNLITRIFINKMEYLLLNGYSKEEVIEKVQSFKSLIITSNSLIENKKRVKNFPGINESYKMLLNFERQLGIKYSL